jgi:hypothetical protein
LGIFFNPYNSPFDPDWHCSQMRIVESIQYNQKFHAMNRSSFTLRLPLSLKSEAARLAKLQGVSLNEWIVAAITEKIAAASLAESSAKARR